MKKIGIITLFAALFCFIASAAMAWPITQWGLTINKGDTIQFQFGDYEHWVDQGTIGTLDVGDVLNGVFYVSSITDQTTPQAPGIVYASNGYTMVGNFTYTVKDINVAPSGSSYYYDVTLSDTMNIYYNAAGTGFTVPPTYKGSSDISDYTTDPGSLIATFSSPIIAHVEVSSLDSSTWLLGSNIVSIINQPITMVYNNSGVPWASWTLESDVNYQSTTGFNFWSTDPIRGATVPEPATIMLLGAGLLGLGSWGKKKAKKDKES